MKGWRKAIRGIIALGLAFVLTMGLVPGNVSFAKEGYEAISSEDFLHAEGRNLYNAKGELINLRGTNAGGYFVQEFWMTPTESAGGVHDQQTMMNALTERFDEEKMYELMDIYESNYWTEADFKNCADLGMNTIRLPFWWRNLVDANGDWYGYDENASDPYKTAFARMDWFINTAAEYGLYVIVDFHGAPGSQNGSDHSGVDGEGNKKAASEFFFGDNAAANQELYYKMFDVISKRYKDNATVAGYDLLNEPFCTYAGNSVTINGVTYTGTQCYQMLWDIYDKAYDIIRANNDNHIVIMEAVWNSDCLPNPATYGWKNVMYEYHNYNYSDYDNEAGSQISSAENKVSNIKNADYDVPSYMGEFCFFNQASAWDKGLEVYTTCGLNWTTWTYKTVDYYGMWGIYHHPANMDNGIDVTTASYDEIASWWSKVGTKEGSKNEALAEVVSKWCNDKTYENTLGATSEKVDTTKSYYLQITNTQDILTVDDNNGLVAGNAPYGFAIEEKGGKVLLKAANGKYLVADSVTKTLSATAETADEAEAFLLNAVTPTALVLKSSTTGLYVTEAKDSKQITASSQTTLGQTTFQLRRMDDGKLYNEEEIKATNGWTKYETLAENVHGEGTKVEEQDFYSDKKASGNMTNDASAEDFLANEDWSTVKNDEFTVNAPKAGTYALVMQYNGDDDKEVVIKVNDEAAEVVSVPRVKDGTWNLLWTKGTIVKLAAGENTIKITGAMKDGWMNLDCIYVTDAPVTVQANGATRYEGENFFSTGYETSGSSNYSNGSARGGLNQEITIDEFNADWSNVRHGEYTVYAETEGTYTISWGHDGRNAEGMTVAYRVNNGENKTLTIDASGWASVSADKFEVELNKGFNVIYISGTIGSTDDWANNDYIDVILKGSEVEVVELPKAISGFTRHEAELELELHGGKLENQDFYSNGQAIGSFDGNNLSFADIAEDWSNVKYGILKVDAVADGTYRMIIGYNGDDDKSIAVKTNDGESKEVSVPAVRDDHSWNTMHEVLTTVELKAGNNVIYISGALNGKWMNPDYIDISNYPVFVDENGVETYEIESHTAVSNESLQHNDAYTGIEELNGLGGMSTSCTFNEGDNIIGSKLHYADYSVFAEKEGYYDITVNAIGAQAVFSCFYQINDNASVAYSIDDTEAGYAWNRFVTANLHVYLNKGYNRVLVSGDCKGKWMNFDHILVAYSVEQSGDYTPEVPDEDEGLDKSPVTLESGYTRYEAEFAEINGGGREHQDVYSGTAERNGVNSMAGTDENFKVGDNIEEFDLRFVKFNINVEKAGEYEIVIVANGADKAMPVVYQVNDGESITVTLDNTVDGYNWDRMLLTTIKVDLVEGDNTFVLAGTYEYIDGAWLNYDYIDVKYVEKEAAPVEETKPSKNNVVNKVVNTLEKIDEKVSALPVPSIIKRVVKKTLNTVKKVQEIIEEKTPLADEVEMEEPETEVEEVVTETIEETVAEAEEVLVANDEVPLAEQASKNVWIWYSIIGLILLLVVTGTTIYATAAKNKED